MGATRIRVCRHHRHVAGWRPQMVGLGHGAHWLGSVAGLRNRLQQTWLHRDERYLDHDSQSQHDCVAQTRIGFNNHRSHIRTYCGLSSTADYFSEIVQPPATAGIIETVEPAGTAVFNPSM
mgnify:CR=1 FL=1